jgi:hypothetical protein
MPWGAYKRSRHDDGEHFTCDECCEECHFDDSLTCGCCENISCSDCMCTVCDGCKALEDKGEDIMGSYVCENCIAYPGCEDCEDATYCKECITDHLKTCSKKSRATRSLSVANREFAECEGKVLTATQEVASAKYRLERLEATLAQAKIRKVEAEAELKAEAEAEVS